MELLIIKIILLLTFINTLALNRSVLGCGLVGFSGKGNYNLDKIRLLMLMNRERGDDASGYFTLKPNFEYMHQRNNWAIDKDLIYSTGFENGMNKFIGHCRKQSIGARILTNAHPFIEKFEENSEVVAAHNGTITNLYNLREHLNEKCENKNYFTISKVNVDSQLFPMYFSCYGVNNTKILSLFEGGAALIFTELPNNDTIYVYRNEERPLHYGFIDGDMYMSSEERPLVTINCSEVKQFEANILYTIRNGVIVNEVTIEKEILVKKQLSVVKHEQKSITGFGRNNTRLKYRSDLILSDKATYNETRQLVEFLNDNPKEAIVNYDTRYIENSCIVSVENTVYEYIKIRYKNKLTDLICLYEYKDENSNNIENITFTYNEELDAIIQSVHFNTKGYRTYKVINIERLLKHLKELDILNNEEDDLKAIETELVNLRILLNNWKRSKVFKKASNSGIDHLIEIITKTVRSQNFTYDSICHIRTRANMRLDIPDSYMLIFAG